MQHTPKRVSDGFISLVRGMNSDKNTTANGEFNPDGLRHDQVSFAVNTTFRGGRAQPRPAFKRLPIKSFIQRTGRFQGAAFYTPDVGDGKLVASIDGHFLQFNVTDTFSVEDVTPTTNTTQTAKVLLDFTVPATGAAVVIAVDSMSWIFEALPTLTIGGKTYTLTDVDDAAGTITATNINDTPTNTVTSGTTISFTIHDGNASSLRQAWLYQAEEYMIIQDGQSKPGIYNGSNVRRAKDREIPTGTVGVYGMGRIWQCLPNRKTFVAGDLVFTEGKRDAILGFTENTFLNEGGAFSVPSNAGTIASMRFLPQLDTSLGQGPLMVMTDHSIFSVDAPVDRTQWKNVTYPIQTISMLTYGALSPNVAVVNSDLFYRAFDGVRSFIVARRTFGQWGNTPVSTEMRRIIEFDQANLLQYSSCEVFDNRLLMTCSPVYSDNGIYHRGLMALDFNLISSMGEKAPPAWESVWTGLNILQLVKGTINGEERLFAFAVNSDSEIEVWEIMRGGKFDLLPEERPITWSFETPSYTWNSPFDLKRLDSGDIWLDKMAGTVGIKVQYRPDQNACWLQWEEWSECVAYEDCVPDYCAVPTVFKPQYRPKKKLKQPQETMDENTCRPFRDCFECQARVEITGFCEVKQMRIHAITRDESQYGGGDRRNERL